MKRLPKEWYRYFWDTDPENVNPEKFDKYVIERILEWGNVSDLQLLKKEFTQERLSEVVKSSKQLSRKTANFFAVIWDIPKKEVLCLTQEFRQQHRQFWPR